jgi:hypothetical protein
LWGWIEFFSFLMLAPILSEVLFFLCNHNYLTIRLLLLI